LAHWTSITIFLGWLPREKCLKLQDNDQHRTLEEMIDVYRFPVKIVEKLKKVGEIKLIMNRLQNELCNKTLLFDFEKVIKFRQMWWELISLETAINHTNWQKIWSL
jgi:hypothetical protein